MSIQNSGKEDVKIMSKKIRELLISLATWEEEQRANEAFRGYEEGQKLVLEFIETISKQTNLELVDELKKKVTNFTRIIFKITQDSLQQLKNRKKLLETQAKALENNTTEEITQNSTEIKEGETAEVKEGETTI